MQGARVLFKLLGAEGEVDTSKLIGHGTITRKRFGVVSSEPSMPENPIVQSVPIRRAAGNALMREKTRQAEEAVTELWTTPQLFACTIGHPGVGYRLSADFSDKVNMDRGSRISDKVLTTCLLQDPNDSNRGPRSTDHLGNSRPKCVIGTEFVKSREGVTFLKCSTGRGWLPLHTPNVC